MEVDRNDLTAFKGPDEKPRSTKGGTGKKKPKSGKRASPARIAEIRAKKAQTCRLCGTSVNVNAHHLIARGMGGSPGGLWTESNIVGLCGSGTTGCHGLVEARNAAACYLLRARLTDAEYSYVITKRGEGWLEKRYPLGIAE